MIRRAVLACLVLAACSPQDKPPETPKPEAQVAAPQTAPQTPPAPTGDAAKYKPAAAGEITVKTPVAGAKVTSPLVVEGVANNDWFFEGQFVAELVVDGEAITTAPAMQSGDKNWTDPGPVGFKASLEFMVTKEQNAELILSEDMPEYIDEANDIRGPARSIRIPVTLMPAAK